MRKTDPVDKSAHQSSQPAPKSAGGQSKPNFDVVPILRARDAQPGDIEHVVEWVLDAGNPYFDWFFSREGALKWIRHSLDRSDSELAVARMRIAADEDNHPVGGYILLSHEELIAARRADTKAMAGLFGGSARRQLIQNLRASSGLFMATAEGDQYLTKIGLQRSYRGSGLGTRILELCVQDCLERRANACVLDVAQDNEPARALYRSAGFIQCHTGANDALSYLGLRLVLV